MAAGRFELKELSTAIDVLARLQGEAYVKDSPRVASELAEIELSYHRQVREIRNKHRPTKAKKAGGL